METSTAIARVQESLLALEMNRLCGAFQGDASGDAQRRETVDQAAAWIAQLWQEDRRFFQKTALPLVAFHAFEEASEDGGNREGPVVSLLERLVDSGSTEERKESVVRHVVDEFRAFVTVLGEDEASTDALLRVTRCFLSASSRHTTCVETLTEVFVQCVTTTRGKKALLQLFEISERLTPAQKVEILLHVCTVEPAANIRELAARSLQSFTVHIPSPTSAVRLLADKSQKVRRIAACCIMTIGMDSLREEFEDSTVAEIIVKIAAQVSGASQEKRFASYVRDYFENAKTLDEMCELSIHLDEAGASYHPMLPKILARAVGSVLTPAFFQGDTFSQRSDLSSL